MNPETGTVVVIEDDPHIADLVDLYLRRDGFRVLLARDGEEGLRVVKQEDPWIVILDVGLPGARDGFDVCREIRASSNRPVLFLTARDDEVDRVLGLELGADDYLVKPFSPRELVARVRAILRRTRETAVPQDIVSVGSLRSPPVNSISWRFCRATSDWPFLDSSYSTGSGEPTGTATSGRSMCTWPSCGRSWASVFHWRRSGASGTDSDEGLTGCGVA